MTETDSPKIVILENILLHSQADNATNNSEPLKVNTKSEKHQKKTVKNVPRGKPKSGRVWKDVKTRFSSVVKTKGIKNPYQKKERLREELKRVKLASRAILAAKEEEKLNKKEKRRENLKRQEENRKKSEIVQVIKNTSKIKRMKKKQLRLIEKRDTTNINK